MGHSLWHGHDALIRFFLDSNTRNVTADTTSESRVDMALPLRPILAPKIRIGSKIQLIILEITLIIKGVLTSKIPKDSVYDKAGGGKP